MLKNLLRLMLKPAKNVFVYFSGKKKKEKPVAVLPFSLKHPKIYRREKLTALNRYLQGGKTNQVESDQPVFSVVINLNHNPEDTFASFESVIHHAEHPCHFIFLGAKKGKTGKILNEKLRNAEFIASGNMDALKKSVMKSGSEYLLFLESGAELTLNSFTTALNNLKSTEQNTVVCGKIVSTKGILLEAGTIVWNNGRLQLYGNGESQSDAEYNFRRFVDCSSGIFLFTTSQRFSDCCDTTCGYRVLRYMLAEFCLNEWKNGGSVLFNPEIIIKYSAGGSQAGIYYGIKNRRERRRLLYHNKELLASHLQKNKENIPFARFAAIKTKRLKILYVDDLVPHISYGAGFPRANKIVHEFLNMGMQVTLYTNTYHEDDTWEKVYRDVDRRIEFVKAGIQNRFNTHLASRNDYYDYIWISRPNNMNALLPQLQALNKNTAIIYDAESIYAERELRKSKYIDGNFDKMGLAEMVEQEIELCKIADAVVTVSKADQKKFISEGVKNTFVLGHLANPAATPANYDSRKDLLFIGNLEHEESPNVDSMIWFIKNVLPILEQKLPDINLHLVGACKIKFLLNLKSKKVHIHGRVEDTTDFYRTCKVFIAPTRFSAGIPLKIVEAASFGIPAVVTNLLKDQLDWEDNRQLLASEPDKNEFAGQIIKLYTDRILWETIRKNALKKVHAEYSYKNFKAVMENLFASVRRR